MTTTTTKMMMMTMMRKSLWATVVSIRTHPLITHTWWWTMANYAPLNASNMAAGGHSNPNAHIANWQPRVDHLFCERIFIAMSLIRPLCHQQIVVVEGNQQVWSNLVNFGTASKPTSSPDHFLTNCFRFLVLYTVYSSGLAVLYLDHSK